MKTSDTKVARSWPATVAGIVGLVVDVGYVAIMFDEQERTSGRFAVVFLFILAVSTLSIVAGVTIARSPWTRLTVLGASTGGFLTAGVLGIFSIGLPLLVAGLLSGAAWIRVASAVRPVPPGAQLLSTVAAIVTGALLVLGIAVS